MWFAGGELFLSGEGGTEVTAAEKNTDLLIF